MDEAVKMPPTKDLWAAVEYFLPHLTFLRTEGLAPNVANDLQGRMRDAAQEAFLMGNLTSKHALVLKQGILALRAGRTFG